jgi:hypothetical protein
VPSVFGNHGHRAKYEEERLLGMLTKQCQMMLSSPDHFVWHLKMQLLTRAYRAYIQQKPDLNELIQHYSIAAESALLAKKQFE